MTTYRLKISSLILTLGAGVFALSLTPALADDKCAGQKWPYYSDDCIKQIVSDICKAGGGGSTCDESEARNLIASGTIKADTSPAIIRKLAPTRVLRPERKRQ